MPSERRRHQLYEEAKKVFSPNSADELMSYLPPVGWADVATKADLGVIRNELDALRAELRGEMAELRGEMGGLRGEMGGLRGEMDSLRADIRTEMAKGFVSTQRWLIATMIAFASVLAAAVLAGAHLR
jgi:hypothetical protein